MESLGAGVEDCVNRGPVSVVVVVTTEGGVIDLQSHFHRPQHLGNERAGAERVARPRSLCAIPLLCSTTVPEFVLFFFFFFCWCSKT